MAQSPSPAPISPLRSTPTGRANGATDQRHMDVPVQVSLSKAGQVLLTDLQVSQAASQLRTVQVPAADYDTFALDLTGGGGTAATD